MHNTAHGHRNIWLFKFEPMTKSALRVRSNMITYACFISDWMVRFTKDYLSMQLHDIAMIWHDNLQNLDVQWSCEVRFIFKLQYLIYSYVYFLTYPEALLLLANCKWTFSYLRSLHYNGVHTVTSHLNLLKILNQAS